MIEKIVIDYLKSTLTIPVYGVVPDSKPQKFVIVELLDEGIQDHIKKATVSVYSYAKSMYDAELIHESIKEAMQNIVSLNTVSASKITGGGRNTDVSNKLPRYEAKINLFYY